MSLYISQTNSNIIDLNSAHTITESGVADKARCIRQASDQSPALVISGSNITVDFSKATLESSSAPYQNEESHQGVGLLLSHCNDVVIKNLNVYGYRVNILLDHCTNITLDHCDASFSQGDRILSEGNPVDKFLNVRSRDAWLGYGCGIELINTTQSTISNSRACNSQSGFLLMNSDRNTLTGDDGSFNSGWGIGLYQSSENLITFDKCDFCNRPWGGGWGGDSSGIVVANQSNSNFFYEDSFTHGGDGFFLTDRVTGGYSDSDKQYHFDGASNDNIVVRCDGSYSSHNAFESTFSDRNSYINDIANNSQYGFWIGFSNRTLIANCEINGNVHDGIAGGQGAFNSVEGNSFADNQENDLHFWSQTDAAKTQKPSKDQEFYANVFADKPKITIERSSAALYDADGKLVSQWGSPDQDLPAIKQLDSFTSKSNYLQLIGKYDANMPTNWTAFSEKLGPANGFPRGQEWITPNDFAPVDFRDHLVAIAYPNPESVKFYILKPGVRLTAPGTMKFASTKDPHVALLQADVPTSNIGGITHYEVNCSLADGTEETYAGDLRASRWFEHWYRWDLPSPIAIDDQSAWDKIWSSKPVAVTHSDKLDADYSGRSPLPTKLPSSYFAVKAWTSINLPTGFLEINTVSDDGIKVYVDNKLQITDWNVHGAKNDRCIVPIQSGVHRIVVEYCQESGSATLQVNWKYKKKNP